MASRRNLPIVAMALVVIAVHLAAAAAGKPQYLTQLTMAGYYSLVIVGLTLLMGYTGQISMGHAGFFAIGGYTSGLLTTYNLHSRSGEMLVSVLRSTGLLVAGKDLYGGDLLVVRPWAACLIALLVTIGIAYLVGKPVLKLRGHYLAMATLGFGTIVYKVVLGSSLVGAADGISDIPAFPLFAGLAVTGKSALRTQNYYLAWGLVLGAMALLTNLIHSRVGRALRAIHGAEDAANAMGVDTSRYKLNMFVLSAALAALGGVFLTHYNGGIGPSEASIMKSVRYVAIVAVGGMANLWGTIGASALLNFLSLRGCFGIYDDAVFGGCLVGMMLFAPQGLLARAMCDRLRALVHGRRRA